MILRTAHSDRQLLLIEIVMKKAPSVHTPQLVYMMSCTTDEEPISCSWLGRNNGPQLRSPTKDMDKLLFQLSVYVDSVIVQYKHEHTVLFFLLQ